MLPDPFPPEPPSLLFDPVRPRSWASPRDTVDGSGVERVAPVEPDSGPVPPPPAAPSAVVPRAGSGERLRLPGGGVLAWATRQATAAVLGAHGNKLPARSATPPRPECLAFSARLALVPHRIGDPAVRADAVLLGGHRAKPANGSLRLAMPIPRRVRQAWSLEQPGAAPTRPTGSPPPQPTACPAGRPIPIGADPSAPNTPPPVSTTRRPPAPPGFAASLPGPARDLAAADVVSISPPNRPGQGPTIPEAPVRRRFRAWRKSPITLLPPVHRPDPFPAAGTGQPDLFRRRPLAHPVAWRVPAYFDMPAASRRTAAISSSPNDIPPPRVPVFGREPVAHRVMAPDPD
jgi:hypothetical protein